MNEDLENLLDYENLNDHKPKDQINELIEPSPGNTKSNKLPGPKICIVGINPSNTKNKSNGTIFLN